MPGLIRGVARTAVVAGTATAVSNRVSRRQASRWSQQEQTEYQPPPEQRSEQPQASRTQQLSELATLREQGVLTEAEFAAEKARVLQS